MKIHQSNLTESNDEMANRIMTNMIKQLASLGRHANDIFGTFIETISIPVLLPLIFVPM